MIGWRLTLRVASPEPLAFRSTSSRTLHPAARITTSATRANITPGRRRGENCFMLTNVPLEYASIQLSVVQPHRKRGRPLARCRHRVELAGLAGLEQPVHHLEHVQRDRPVRTMRPACLCGAHHV